MPDRLNVVRRSMINDCKSGKLHIQAKRAYVSPDLYAFCERLFEGIENPHGLLDGKQVYCDLFSNGQEIDCLRNPHSYREHCIRTNTITSSCSKWFDTHCIYTSTRDLISKVLTFDCDGDTLLLVSNPTFVKVAKRNMQGVVPLYYEMSKGHKCVLTKNSIYDGLQRSFESGCIGEYSNKLTKIWNKPITPQTDKISKWLTAETNFKIDSAKTSYMPVRPEEVDIEIKAALNGKMPYFFHFAKDYTSNQVEEITTDNTMGKLVSYITERTKDNRMAICNTLAKCDYHVLCSGDFECVDEEAEQIALTFIIGAQWYFWKIKCNNKQHAANLTDEDIDLNTYSHLQYRHLREDMLSLIDRDEEYIVNALVYYFYHMKKSANKRALWKIYGAEILAHIQINAKTLPDMCPICGKRFVPKQSNYKYCSPECSKMYNKMQARQRKYIKSTT